MTTEGVQISALDRFRIPFIWGLGMSGGYAPGAMLGFP